MYRPGPGFFAPCQPGLQRGVRGVPPRLKKKNARGLLHRRTLPLLDSLAVDCRFEPAVGGTSEALRVAVLPIREGKCLPGVFAPNGQ